MSFGFSIGDIILLSQLTYELYSSLSSGRQAASRDLKELEEVLFSLKCALDHLKEASSDVLARPDVQYGGSGLKEKLDVMIGSCASTLQELDKVTKKHRDVEIHANKGKTKLRTLDDVKRSIHVNWQRVRWDREKLSLQQYREKLKSHTDAINLMLTSIIWANTAFANADSKKNHDVTHSLLDNVLRNPVADPEIRSMVEEMHAMLTKSPARAQEDHMEAIGRTGSSPNEVGVTANSLSGSMFDELPSPIAEELQMATVQSTEPPHDQLDVAAYSLSGSSIGESPVPIKKYGRGLPLVSMYAISALPCRTPTADAYIRPASTTVSVRGVGGATPWKRQSTAESAPRHRGLTRHAELPSATIQLNNKRRAFGAKEYEAFKQRHAQTKKAPKPSFLTSLAPTSQELQACIPYIFQSTAEGKQQTQELKNEITRWTHEFSRFVNDGNVTKKVKDKGVLALLGALNEAVDSSTVKMRQLFYGTSNSAGFTSVLDQIETASKSVRIMKEIEEFQDVKEEWSEQSVR